MSQDVRLRLFDCPKKSNKLSGGFVREACPYIAISIYKILLNLLNPSKKFRYLCEIYNGVVW